MRRLRRRSLGRGIASRHTAIDYKVRAIDKAALVASEEQDSLSLLDSLAEAARREVDFAAVTLGLVVAEPVLEKGGAGCC